MTKNDRGARREWRSNGGPLVVCLWVVPMIGFWREARGFASDVQRQRVWSALRASDGAVGGSETMMKRLLWTFGEADPVRLPR